MELDSQLELKQAEFTIPGREFAQSSGIKSILLHVQDEGSLDERLENALSLARACSAHLTLLQVTPIEAYVAFDGFGGVFVMNDVIKALDQSVQDLRARAESRLLGEDVSWDYEQVTGNVESHIVGRAALCDLIVTGRTPSKSDISSPVIGVLGDLISRSRTPLFIPSEGGRPCDPSGAAVIAWDGSYEAANAVRSSLGLLKISSDVRVVRVEEKEERFPSTRLLEYLSRHGIHAELSVETAGPDTDDPYFVSCILMERARELNGYLVMGGYNHSRIGEYIFGGVTRTLLSGSIVPLVIAR